MTSRESEDIGPVEEITAEIYDALEEGGLAERLQEVISRRYDRAIAIEQDQNDFIEQEVERRLVDAFKNVASSMSASDGWLRLTVSHGRYLSATINIRDHIEAGIRDVETVEMLPEDAAETVAGLDTFILKLTELRNAVAKRAMGAPSDQ